MAHDSDSSGRWANLKGEENGNVNYSSSSLFPSRHFVKQKCGVCAGKGVRKKEAGRYKLVEICTSPRSGGSTVKAKALSLPTRADFDLKCTSVFSVFQDHGHLLIFPDSMIFSHLEKRTSK